MLKNFESRANIHAKLNDVNNDIMLAYGECTKKQVNYFLHKLGWSQPCPPDNIDKVSRVYEQRGRNANELFTYLSIIEKMVTPVLTTSATIVGDLNNLGYSVEHLSMNDTEGKARIPEGKFPTRKATSYAVVRGENGFTEVMAVFKGEIDTNTCPVKEITCAKQSIPLVKLAKMIGELVWLKKDTGFMVAEMNPTFLASSGLGTILSNPVTNARRVMLSLGKVYKYADRKVPAETMKGAAFNAEIEAVLTIAYGKYFKLIRENVDDKVAFEMFCELESNITGLFNQAGLKDHEKAVFQTEIDDSSPCFDVVYPKMALPNTILGKKIDNKGHQANCSEAVNAMLDIRSRRGKDYNEKSATTRMLSSPFPLTKEVYEAARLRTNIEPHIFGYNKLRIHLSEIKDVGGTYETLFNALYMMNYTGTVYVDRSEALRIINTNEVRGKKTKFDDKQEFFKFGDGKFKIIICENFYTVHDDDQTMNLLFKHYNVNESSGVEWISSYNESRSKMCLDAYGTNLLFAVYLTDAEVRIKSQGVLYSAVTKHNLVGYRCIGSHSDAYVANNCVGTAYEKRVARACMPDTITEENDVFFYYECILQNVVRAQYNFTSRGFIEAYQDLNIRLQYLNLQGMRFIKPRGITVHGMDITHFVRVGAVERLREVMDSSIYGKTVITNNNMLERAQEVLNSKKNQVEEVKEEEEDVDEGQENEDREEEEKLVRNTRAKKPREYSEELI